MPHAQGVLLGLAKFNRIKSIDQESATAVVEPGVRNLAVSEAVSKYGLYYAPDPSSQIACTIGGNVAENSGGVHCLKYVPGTIDTNADLTITGETTGVPIFTKANVGTSTAWYYPRVLGTKHTDGSDLSDVAMDISVLNERIKVVVAQGGDTLTGTITAYVDVCA